MMLLLCSYGAHAVLLRRLGMLVLCSYGAPVELLPLSYGAPTEFLRTYPELLYLQLLMCSYGTPT